MAGVIYLAYLNGYAPPWADILAQGVEATFDEPVQPLAVQVDTGPAYAPDRRQYHTTLLLAGLLRRLSEQGSEILGITGVDLYIPVLTFVFGQSQLGGSGAGISTYRLRTEFYDLPPDEGLLVERTIKEAVHELGHAFGLVHCSDYTCVVSVSTYVEEVDLKDAGFCRACRAALAAGT